MKKHGSEYSKDERDNNANIHNPNNWRYQEPQKNYVPIQADRDNRAGQLDPNNDKYRKSRGF